MIEDNGQKGAVLQTIGNDDDAPVMSEVKSMWKRTCLLTLPVPKAMIVCHTLQLQLRITIACEQMSHERHLMRALSRWDKGQASHTLSIQR